MVQKKLDLVQVNSKEGWFITGNMTLSKEEQPKSCLSFCDLLSRC